MSELIELARASILSGLGEKNDLSTLKTKLMKDFSDRQGVFVTISKAGELRGCIGYPQPVLPLYEAVINAANSAAFEDPRFTPLDKGEYGSISVEVSVLSVPELIEVESTKEYPKKIKIGKDGLIVRSGGFSGLLLPQVATEQGWDSEEFLEHTCLKAGLSQDAWLDSKTEVLSFRAEIFKD